MASTECIQVATLGSFRERVEYFLFNYVLETVVSESQDSPPTALQTARRELAKAILAKRVNIPAFSLAAVTNDTIAATIGTEASATVAADSISDNDLQYVVEAELYNVFARV